MWHSSLDPPTLGAGTHWEDTSMIPWWMRAFPLGNQKANSWRSSASADGSCQRTPEGSLAPWKLQSLQWFVSIFPKAFDVLKLLTAVVPLLNKSWPLEWLFTTTATPSTTTRPANPNESSVWKDGMDLVCLLRWKVTWMPSSAIKVNSEAPSTPASAPVQPTGLDQVVAAQPLTLWR